MPQRTCTWANASQRTPVTNNFAFSLEFSFTAHMHRGKLSNIYFFYLYLDRLSKGGLCAFEVGGSQGGSTLAHQTHAVAPAGCFPNGLYIQTLRWHLQHPLLNRQKRSQVSTPNTPTPSFMAAHKSGFSKPNRRRGFVPATIA